MNYLTEKKYVQAWVESFIQAEAGSHLLLGNLREAYERATRLPFDNGESGLIRQNLVECCTEFWGATRPSGAADDDAVLTGVSLRPEQRMYGKPVLYVAAKTIINVDSAFNHKDLSSAGAANCGTACAYSCGYCSTGASMNRNPQVRILEVLGVRHGDVVIRRLDALETARTQLLNPDGSRIYNDPADTRVMELASIVDPLPNNELMEETYMLVKTVFELTPWRVRILTKSGLLAPFARRFSETERKRLLLGFSIGIPEDDIAHDLERDTTPPSTRFRIHNDLLQEGFTMFQMSCPVLAVADFRQLAEHLAAKLQTERMERVWCEVINGRGGSLIKTIAALQPNHPELAARMGRVARSEVLWEIEYNRAAFLAFKEVIPAGKLSYLTYVTEESQGWWSQYAGQGAVLL